MKKTCHFVPATGKKCTLHAAPLPSLHGGRRGRHATAERALGCPASCGTSAACCMTARRVVRVCGNVHAAALSHLPTQRHVPRLPQACRHGGVAGTSGRRWAPQVAPLAGTASAAWLVLSRSTCCSSCTRASKTWASEHLGFLPELESWIPALEDRTEFLTRALQVSSHEAGLHIHCCKWPSARQWNPCVGDIFSAVVVALL